MRPVQIFSEFDYVCLCDRKLPESEQTIFVLTSLTIEQDAYLEDHMEGEIGKAKYGTVIINALHMGLKGVKNFRNGKKEIKFKRDENGFEFPGKLRPWRSEFLQRIAIPERRELVTKIRALGTIEEAELKNS